MATAILEVAITHTLAGSVYTASYLAFDHRRPVSPHLNDFSHPRSRLPLTTLIAPYKPSESAPNKEECALGGKAV